MKLFFAPFAFVIILATSFRCSPQLMQAVNDAQKLKVNENLFIDKPLKKLLKEIRPEIKMVWVRESWAEEIGMITFNFVDREGYKKYNKESKVPIHINITIKEELKWDKPAAEREKWTKEDAKKYGNLTVLRMSVFGDSL